MLDFGIKKCLWPGPQQDTCVEVQTMKHIVIHISIIKETYASVFEYLHRCVDTVGGLILILYRCPGMENFTEMIIFKLSLIKDEEKLRGIGNTGYKKGEEEGQ